MILLRFGRRILNHEHLQGSWQWLSSNHHRLSKCDGTTIILKMAFNNLWIMHIQRDVADICYFLSPRACGTIFQKFDKLTLYQPIWINRNRKLGWLVHSQLESHSFFFMAKGLGFRRERRERRANNAIFSNSKAHNCIAEKSIVVAVHMKSKHDNVCQTYRSDVCACRQAFGCTAISSGCLIYQAKIPFSYLQNFASAGITNGPWLGGLNTPTDSHSTP